MIKRLAEGTLKTRYGEFREVLYYDGQRESIAMIMGNVADESDVLCRVHSSCIFGHYFNSIECDCQAEMDTSQKLIEASGKGIIILLDQEGKGNGHFALLNSVTFKRKGLKQADAYEAAGFPKDARDFSPAAKILNDLDVRSVILLTDNEKKVKTLAEKGIKVSGTRKILKP